MRSHPVLVTLFRFFVRSIRRRLALLVVAVVLPAGLLVGWLIVQSYAHQRTAVERQLAATARSLSLLVDAAFRERIATLQALATSPALAEPDLAALREQAAAVTSGRGEWVVFADRDGQQLLNTGQPPGAVLPRMTELPELQEAAEQGRTYVSNLVLGAARRRPVVFVAVPVFAEGQLRYILSLGMEPTVLMEPLQAHRSAAPLLVTLIDRDGVIAVRGSAPAVGLTETIAPDLWPGPDARHDAVREMTAADGARQFVAFDSCEESAWTVMLAAPADQLLVSARNLAAVAWLVSILSGVVVTLAAWRLGRGVVHGVQRLVHATERLGRGEGIGPPATGIDETDHIARALQESSQMLLAREQELAQARDEAVAASRAKDEFLAALSHELRTPLNPVLLVASDAAVDLAYPAEAREAFRVIEKNARLEARLIDDLLDLTRITRGKMSLTVEAVDLHQVLRDALATVQGELQAKRLSLQLLLNAERATVVGDATRLQQVFWNVLRNAIKFTPPEGVVRVLTTVDAVESEVLVEITDSGMGMTAPELGRLFQPFVQGDHAGEGGRRAQRFGGLGLGLVISRRLVELHSGRIAASSQGPGRGSTFAVRLPVMSATTPTVAAAPTGAGPVRAPAVLAGPRAVGLRLLLVEDHDPTRGALGDLLTRRGHAVVSVATVAAARAQVARLRFDLLLSDLGLPDGDGCDLMKELRQRFGLRGVALTGYGAEEDVVRSREAGFLAHLTKPVGIEALDAALAQAQVAQPAGDSQSTESGARPAHA